MQEATDQRVEWAETDEMTFVLFSQFAYTGDYDGQEQRPSQPLGSERPSQPLRSERLDSDDGQETLPAENYDAHDDWGVSFASSRRKKKKSKYYEVPAPLEANPCPDTLFTVLSKRFKDQCPDVLCDHGTVCWPDGPEVLLVHARMYTFADYHGITQLQTLVLRKLHRILVQFKLSHESIGSIAALVRHTYQHTRPDSNDRLRSMISLYGACNLLEFRENEDFDLLLRTVGDFSGDLFQKISMQ